MEAQPRRVRVPHVQRDERAAFAGFLAIKDELRLTATDLMGLGHNHCRFIVSGDGEPTAYCGDVKEPGTSYCRDHYRLCYKPVSQGTSGERRVSYVPRIVREGARA